MSPRTRSIVAAWFVAQSAGALFACATSDATVGDPDAGLGDDAGPLPTKDGSVQTPPKKDAGPADPDAGVFVDPDAATCVKSPPSNVCGVSPQCGCAPSETCDVTDNVGTAGCISFGTAAQGRFCGSTASCAKGLTCINNVCRPFCPPGLPDGGGCGLPGTSTCRSIVDGTQKPIPNLNVCRLACDLTNARSCDDAGVVGCEPDSTNQADCFPAGSSTTTCAGATLCAPAYGCVTVTVNDAGSDLCKKWCKVGKASPTCGGADCTGFSKALLVGGVEYGACP